jgi:ABC-type polysaccharide/polyol phosphate transport system ATPase subunit
LIRRKSISSEDVNSRYSLSVGLSELKHNAQKVSDNKAFIDEITKILKELIVRLNFSKSNAQLRNCVNVLDLLRRQKAIAFVGPVCSGKTTVLKIVSNILHVAFKIKLRTSVVNTATMTSKELYGSIDAFNKYPKTNIAT